MNRKIIFHVCRRDECAGEYAQWHGRSLHCTTCDAWQRHKVSLAKKSDSVPKVAKSRIFTDINDNTKVLTVEFECGVCGEMNVTMDFKKIEEGERVTYQLHCYECSTKNYLSA